MVSDGEQHQENITTEMRAAIRKEAVQQTAKWAIGAFVALAGFALVGWWFYFEPKVRDYIISAGGVPQGAVIASLEKCSSLSGEWSTFTEGTGRFIVGAGDETHRAYGTWDLALPQGGVQPIPVSTYVVLAKGGEERHQLSIPEIPNHSHGYDNEAGIDGNRSGQQDATYRRIGSQTTAVGGDQPHNNIPPFIALYFCKKG